MEPTKEQIEAALNQSDEITDWLPETKRYYRSDYQNSIIDLAAAYRAEHERAERLAALLEWFTDWADANRELVGILTGSVTDRMITKARAALADAPTEEPK